MDLPSDEELVKDFGSEGEGSEEDGDFDGNDNNSGSD